jgi:ubiquinone/menaquinone biosynthesis C-methylase UbiE
MMKHGDFTELAGNYAKYRPGYSRFVAETVIRSCRAHGRKQRPVVADVGAGTGIWSRMLAEQGAKVTAVEPNEAMRAEGEKASSPGAAKTIAWVNGSAERTTLPQGHFDLVCMASSFHWTDFDRAVAEFKRILVPEGVFAALWNTRHYESNPVLLNIEKKLHSLMPDMQRVSSGRSEFCDSLTQRLLDCGLFADVLYLEGLHTERQSREHYIGLWESVNDVRVQAGPERFSAFIEYIRREVDQIPYIDAQYKTRAWLARLRAV